MRQHQRMLCRIASRRAYHPHFGRRFDALVVQRKSWGYWFVARVAGMSAPRLQLDARRDFLTGIAWTPAESRIIEREFYKS